ncbi:MAG TPA: RNA polymerase sigma factor [Polyangiaceae bacterium]|nr:RNA polymerase sigma factor [Polyangiaceae bacterium]
MNPWYLAPLVSAELVTQKVEHSLDPFLLALAHGDRQALSAAYREHHRAVRTFACRLLGDESAAEDLVQEAFLALPAAVRRFRGETSLRSFVIAVAVNHARHFVRAAARRRKHTQRLAGEPATATTTPDDRLARAELGDALFRSLDELPLDQRIAFVLCVIEERSSQEAAEITGSPSPTVRARVQAAKKRLRELLDEGGLR